MGVIYKLTNLINNKIYIGQTVVTEPRRWQQHLYWSMHDPSMDCIVLCNAIKKYGKEYFKREIIEHIENERLNEREQYWIAYYHSTDPQYGYNITQGGKGHQKFSDEQILQAYNSTHSIVETAFLLNAHRSTIENRLHALNIDARRDANLLQYDINGNLLATFTNKVTAKTKLQSNLTLIPNTRAYQSKHWIFIRENDDTSIFDIIPLVEAKIRSHSEVEQYDLDGNLLHIYDNAAQASQSTNINVSSIKAALVGVQVTAGNYLWRRRYSLITKEEMIYNYITSSRCCSIDEIDQNGNIIQTFASPNKAEQYYHFSWNTVKPICDHLRGPINNHNFQYHNQQKRLWVELQLNEKAGG